MYFRILQLHETQMNRSTSSRQGTSKAHATDREEDALHQCLSHLPMFHPSHNVGLTDCTNAELDDSLLNIAATAKENMCQYFASRQDHRKLKIPHVYVYSKDRLIGKSKATLVQIIEEDLQHLSAISPQQGQHMR